MYRSVLSKAGTEIISASSHDEIARKPMRGFNFVPIQSDLMLIFPEWKSALSWHDQL